MDTTMLLVFFLLNTLSYLNNNNAIKNKHPNKHVSLLMYDVYYCMVMQKIQHPIFKFRV